MEADEDIIDGSLFQGRDENDPLILQKRELDRIKAELAKALAARADKTKKASADDDKKKAELQRMLLS